MQYLSKAGYYQTLISKTYISESLIRNVCGRTEEIVRKGNYQREIRLTVCKPAGECVAKGSYRLVDIAQNY